MANEEVRGVADIIAEITERLEEFKALVAQRDERIDELETLLAARDERIKEFEEEDAESETAEGCIDDHMTIDESDLATQVRALRYRRNMPEQELATALQICHRSREMSTNELKRRGLTVETARSSRDRLDKQLVVEIGEARKKWLELKDGSGLTKDQAVALRKKYYTPSRGTKPR